LRLEEWLDMETDMKEALWQSLEWILEGEKAQKE
jgi:hypothetical protein